MDNIRGYIHALDISWIISVDNIRGYIHALEILWIISWIIALGVHV